jgi:hypothetical protein
MKDDDRDWYSPNSPKAPSRKPDGVEAQLLDPVEIRIARTFRRTWTRRARHVRWRLRGRQKNAE